MIINKSGIAIRLEVANLRTMGRATQGVKLINLKGSDSIAAVAKVMHDEDDVENAEGAESVEGLENTGASEDGTTLDNNINEDNTDN